MPDHAVVVGAGVAGLSAAIRLASLGLSVDVVEAADRPGGKAGVAVVDGVEVDTGPSVLTLPEAFDRVLLPAGTRLRDEVRLRRHSPAFRYRYPDGSVLDVHHDVEETLASVGATFGPGAARELEGYLAAMARTWEIAAPTFVEGPAPTVSALLARGWSGLRMLTEVDPLRSMQRAVALRVRDERLRWLLWRYATYNGSDVRRAPATLGCIAHVELALGGFGVEGGMSALVDALVRVATRCGVQLHCGRPVTRILSRPGAVAGVELAGGAALPASVVVFGGDVGALGSLVPALARPRRRPPASMSAWTGILRAGWRPGRVPHEVLFPQDYAREFADIFDHGRPPVDPTIYVCAQEPCHGRRGWPKHEALFVMTNAPAPGASAPEDAHAWDAHAGRVAERLAGHGLAAPEDRFAWTRTPAQLAAAFPGSGGALYGPASNTLSAAFRRAPNRVAAMPGLYVASGSAHPGGGLPLAALSGLQAALCAAEDRGLGDLVYPLPTRSLKC